MHQPTDSNRTSFGVELVHNLTAALTVSFVAISLGAAFGILSGRGAFAGIISAGVIALITALLGGTRIQCSGPTAPMTSVTVLLVAFATTELVQSIPSADPDQFVNLVFLLTGVLLLLTAVLRLGRFISVVPIPVISGFMDGIAILIWLDQIKKLFGLAGKEPIGGSLAGNVAVVVGTTVLAFWLPKIVKSLRPSLHFLPGTLIAIVIMTVVVQVLSIPIDTVSLQTTLNSWSDIVVLVESQFPRQWSFDLLTLAAPFALQLLMLCYLDTLLTSLVVDKKMQEMFHSEERTKQNKELAAQGAANAAIALFGGIPGAQATIRSVLILNERATWRLAGVMVGVFVMVEMILFQEYISLIPQAVFTGILIKVGYDVFDWSPVVYYWKYSRSTSKTAGRSPEPAHAVSGEDMFFIAGTAAVTVVVNLNVAVISFCLLYYLMRVKIVQRDPKLFYRGVMVAASLMGIGWAFYAVERSALNQAIEEARNDGAPLTLVEIEASRRTWPEEENGALVIEPLMPRLAELIEDERLGELPIVGGGDEPALGKRWTPETDQRVSEELTRLLPVLKTIDRLRHYTGGRFIPASAPTPDESATIFASEVHQAVKLKSLQTIQRAMHGETDSLVDDIMIMTHLSRLILDEPSLSAAVGGDTCDEEIVWTLQHVCSHVTLQDDQLVQIYNQLSELEEHDNARMYWAFLGERARFVDAYELFTTYGFVALRGWYLRDEASGLKLYNNVVHAARTPTEMLKVADSLEEQFHRELEKLDKHYPSSGIVEHSLHRPFALHVRTMAEVRCARTATAVEQFRIDTGQLPATLTELIPEYLDSMQRDPFDGEPLRYDVDENRAVVYSVGENMVDDGGRVRDPTMPDGADDAGFILLAPNRRSAPVRE